MYKEKAASKSKTEVITCRSRGYWYLLRYLSQRGYCDSTPARGCACLTTRVFYSKLVYTVASIDTRCIDSNLESGRYISRVGRASRFLSLLR